MGIWAPNGWTLGEQFTDGTMLTRRCRHILLRCMRLWQRNVNRRHACDRDPSDDVGNDPD